MTGLRLSRERVSRVTVQGSANDRNDPYDVEVIEKLATEKMQ